MARRVSSPKNLLDRAIEAISPRWGMDRAHARTMLALSSTFIGGSRSRPSMVNYNPLAGDPDDELTWDLPTLRARSRDLYKNAPVATGAINTNVTNVIGTGLSLQSRIKAKVLGLTPEQAAAWQDNTEYRFNVWYESTECDITRTQDGYGLQELVYRSMLESGDVFVPIVTARNNKTSKLALQVIEADRVMNPNNQQNTATLVDGIALDEYGAPKAYHVCKTHPGKIFRGGSLEFTEMPAYTPSGRLAVQHLFERKRPGQHRGYPYLAPIIEPLKQLDRYTEAELTAAVVNAVHAFFIKMDAEAFGSLFGDEGGKEYIKGASKWDGSLPEADIGNAGKVINLLPGEDVVKPDESRPNINFDPFVSAILKQIGTALELPFEVLMKLFSNSYTAARAAILDAWRVFRRRRAFIATYHCQPTYEAFLDEEVANGNIIAPGYFVDPYLRAAWLGSVWVGDGMGAIDPYKEIQAAKMRIEEDVSTRDAESIAYDGVPWDIKVQQRIKEESVRKNGGLIQEQKPAPAPTVEPRPDEEDDRKGD
jgi:lambda family phage portal protein